VAASAFVTGNDSTCDLVAIQLYAVSLPLVTGGRGADLAPQLVERPLGVTSWATDPKVSRDDSLLIENMKTCLAAAFFQEEVRKAKSMQQITPTTVTMHQR
jgi:hypothetical protein